MAGQILKSILVLIGSFLFMYNILQIDSEPMKYFEGHRYPIYYGIRYFYHTWNILGASLGFALLFTVILYNKQEHI